MLIETTSLPKLLALYTPCSVSWISVLAPNSVQYELLRRGCQVADKSGYHHFGRVRLVSSPESIFNIQH